MHFTQNDIKNLERVNRLNLINSITGIKPANLIGTISSKQQTNLAIFSSVMHLGSDPALLGFILRPAQDIPRHTFENIMENGFYTINHVQTSFIEKAHYTSTKFKKEDSEFEKCQLTEEYIADFKAPFVKESTIKLGMKFVESIPIKLNKTLLIIGEIVHLIIPDTTIDANGYMDLGLLDNVGISGLNSYYKLEKITDFPFARPNELPNFSE
ncbi:MAG: flavin reductase [Lutibacter sp.]|nr:flavin reductase [Lutibacter sp.]MDT8418611.1 flavin reductase [Lutibacter sp.]